MKVNSIDKNNISFNGFYDSKALKKFLSFAENNGALFASTAALALSATVRPLAILATPRTDKENKKIACAKAITSTLLDFGITFAIAAPIVKAVGKINKNPRKYLTSETINNLKGNSEAIQESKDYTLATQMFKLGAGLIVAVPKAVLNVIGMPYITSAFFGKSKNNQEKNNSENVIFKGKGNDKLADIISKTINNNKVQDFSKKHSDSNFPMHINALKDSIATGVFIIGAGKSKKIDEDRKSPLIYNSAIATILSIISGYIIDAATKKPADNFVKKFCEVNKNDPNLSKYLDGVKIAKPILILATVYYALIPVISTFFAERIGKK